MTSTCLNQENLSITSEGVIYSPNPRGRECAFCFKRGIQTEQEESQQQRMGGTQQDDEHESLCNHTLGCNPSQGPNLQTPNTNPKFCLYPLMQPQYARLPNVPLVLSIVSLEDGTALNLTTITSPEVKMRPYKPPRIVACSPQYCPCLLSFTDHLVNRLTRGDMSSQEFHVHSQHQDLNPSLLLPKRLKWEGAQGPIASLEPKEACKVTNPRVERSAGWEPG